MNSGLNLGPTPHRVEELLTPLEETGAVSAKAAVKTVKGRPIAPPWRRRVVFSLLLRTAEAQQRIWAFADQRHRKPRAIS